MRFHPELPGCYRLSINWSNPGSQPFPLILGFRFVRPQLCRYMSNNHNFPGASRGHQMHKLHSNPSSSQGTLSQRHRRLQLRPWRRNARHTQAPTKTMLQGSSDVERSTHHHGDDHTKKLEHSSFRTRSPIGIVGPIWNRGPERIAIRKRVPDINTNL